MLVPAAPDPDCVETLSVPSRSDRFGGRDGTLRDRCRRQPNLACYRLGRTGSTPTTRCVRSTFVVALDVAALGFAGVTPAATGRPSYHLAVLLELYAYGYLSGMAEQAKAALAAESLDADPGAPEASRLKPLVRFLDGMTPVRLALLSRTL